MTINWANPVGMQSQITANGAELQINFSQLLGAGSFGQVYGGSYTLNNTTTQVAVKVQQNSFSTGKDASASFAKEIRFNMIQGIFLEHFQVGSQQILIMPNLGTQLEPPDGFEFYHKPTPAKASVSQSSSQTTSQPASQPAAPFSIQGTRSAIFSSQDSGFMPASLGTDGSMIIKENTGPSMAGTMQSLDLDDLTEDLLIEALPTPTPKAEPAVEATKVHNPLHQATLPHMQDFLDVFIKMAREVERTHANGILHLDIKEENFLIDWDQMKVTLVDYGLSEFMKDNTPKKTQGTLDYMGPELLSSNPQGSFGPSQDIYALGAVFCNSYGSQLSFLQDGIFVRATKEAVKLSLSAISDPLKRAEALKGAEFILGYVLRKKDRITDVRIDNNHQDIDIAIANQLLDLMAAMTRATEEKRPTIQQVAATLEHLKMMHQAYHEALLDALQQLDLTADDKDNIKALQSHLNHWHFDAAPNDSLATTITLVPDDQLAKELLTDYKEKTQGMQLSSRVAACQAQLSEFMSELLGKEPSPRNKTILSKFGHQSLNQQRIKLCDDLLATLNAMQDEPSFEKWSSQMNQKLDEVLTNYSPHKLHGVQEKDKFESLLESLKETVNLRQSQAHNPTTNRRP